MVGLVMYSSCDLQFSKLNMKMVPHAEIAKKVHIYNKDVSMRELKWDCLCEIGKMLICMYLMNNAVL